MSTYQTPIPGGVQYSQRALLARTAYQNALNRINQQRMSGLRQRGYTADIDATTGTLRNLRVDALNPYGQYQEDRASHAVMDENLTDSLLSRGIKGGLAKQQQTELRHEFGRDNNALGQAVIGDVDAWQEQQNFAAYELNRALYEAQQDATQQAIASGNFSPGDYTGLDMPTYGEEDSTIPAETPARTPAVAPGPAASSPSGGKATVNWGGKNRNREQLIKYLVSRGVKPGTWAKKHPDAARRLGIKGGK